MSDKLQRTIARFQERISNKDYYEAHQTLRTITNRYVKAKQYPLAMQILNEGASSLAASKEYASASDLISYLIQVYVESGQPCAGTAKSVLMELINMLPDTEPSLGDLAKDAVAWSQKDAGLEGQAKSQFGDAQLHHLFGQKFLGALPAAKSEDDRYKVFAAAELHLVLGTHESVPVYTDFLYTWWAESPNADPGLFIARAVINYGYLKNIKFMNVAHERFKKQCESGPRVQAHEVYEFVELLVHTLGKADAGDKFMKLYGHYKSVLAEQELVAPVEYLGRFFFGLNLGSSGANNNMLANLMGGLFK